MKTIVVTGAGPLTGLAIARRFGGEGFRAALIARRRESLDAMVATLAAETIEAMSYSPMGLTLVKPSDITADIARERFEFLVIGAINAARQVLPEMIARGGGSILLGNGRSAILPMAMIGSMTL